MLWDSLQRARLHGEWGHTYKLTGDIHTLRQELISRGDVYYRTLAAGFYWSFIVIEQSPGVGVAIAELNRDPVKLIVHKQPTQNDNAPGQDDGNADGN